MWLVGTQRRLPSPGLQVEVVILDHDAPIPRKRAAEGTGSQSAGGATEASAGSVGQEKAGAEEGSREAEAADAGGDAKGTGVDASNGEGLRGHGGLHGELFMLHMCGCFFFLAPVFHESALHEHYKSAWENRGCGGVVLWRFRECTPMLSGRSKCGE